MAESNRSRYLAFIGRLAPALIITGACASAGATPLKFPDVQKLAMAGDYQAQRNLAYGYSSWPYPGQTKDPVQACAWRKVIAASGSTRVDETDRNNLVVACNPLPPAELAAAKQRASGLYLEIYKRPMP